MFQKLLEAIALALQKKAIDYMVIGGQALLIYGEPRLTKDIDITLGIGPDRLKDILKLAVTSDWKVLVDNPKEFVERTWVLPCLEEVSGIRIDFIFSFSEYEQQAMKRTNLITLGCTKIHFASVEDLIVHKIIAGRPRDLEDVKNVMIKNPKIDKAYIRRWLSEFEKSLGESYLLRFEKK